MTWEIRQHENGTYLVYDNEGWYVMSCQDEQRAQLVAQAPVMLEALEAIREKAEYMMSQARTLAVGAGWQAVRDHADTAIAAVKGEGNDEDELV